MPADSPPSTRAGASTSTDSAQAARMHTGTDSTTRFRLATATTRMRAINTSPDRAEPVDGTTPVVSPAPGIVSSVIGLDRP
jgi:hypothetical protein